MVEGESDRDAFGLMLEKKFGVEYEKKWAVAPAGGKALVIAILEKEPDWLGLIDRDEWVEATINEKKAQHPNMNILPRFCLENYLVEPHEIWAALPGPQMNKIPGGFEQLESEIMENRKSWVRHGVLRTVINPLWDGLIARGFHSELLDFDNAQDDVKIKKALKKWHDFLDPEGLFRKFKKSLEDVARKSPFEQITLWTDGKEFFKSHVCSVLNRHLGQESAEERQKQIFRGLPLPDDLGFIWEKFGI